MSEEIKKTESIFLPASQSKRLWNHLLDGLFIYIIAFIIDLIIPINLLEEENYLFMLLFVIIFYLIFETTWAKTPAKFITATKVITEDGEKPILSEVLKRTLIRFVPFEIFSFFSSSNPRGWHDKWSKTIVVDDLPVPENKER